MTPAWTHQVHQEGEAANFGFGKQVFMSCDQIAIEYSFTHNDPTTWWEKDVQLFSSWI